MTLQEADKLFATPERIALVEGLIKGPGRHARLTGLPGSAPAMLFAALKRRKHPYIVIADDAETAGYLYHDLCQIAGEETVAIFPSGYKRDIKYGRPDPPQQILRTDALNAWANSSKLRWLVTSPDALAEKVPVPDRLSDKTIMIESGKEYGLTELLMKLRERGFTETDYVYEPGQFAHRGSIVDVFSYSNTLPFRIDFFGDEIDSIRVFNIETL